MLKPYDPKTIEAKWQKTWRENRLFQGVIKANQAEKSQKEKFYALYAFPYPSGSGLHVGHVEPMTALDMLVRYSRMAGKDVFFPIGWDAFGLPAENFAIKTGVPPAKTTKQSIKNFETQVARIGISYDWESEVATCHPGYYKWTQWIFIELFKAGLAYRDVSSVNWCPSDKTVLANEQVINGTCERCGAKVVQKELEQWKFKITAFQDQLIDDLALVDWPKSTKLQQANWIGRSQGSVVKFELTDTLQTLECFTTRLDTIYGVTFIVISPEKFHDLCLISHISESQRNAVNTYLDAALHKTEEERRVGEKDKTGVFTGIFAKHPLTSEPIPLWIADYVLAGYGTGIVMGVPALDERDRAFATKHQLEVRETKLTDSEVLLKQSPEKFEKRTTYKLRDWLISRQRYWGAPIPMVYCAACAAQQKGEKAAMPGWYAVQESDLPVLLPEVPDFLPTDDGHSPLEKASDAWKYTVCPGCQGQAKREVDTMDTFVDSSWYFLRYCDARNESEIFDKNIVKDWLPVNTYLIGPEHIVLHLLYARFFTKFLRDLGYLKFSEPFMKMRHQGMILGPDGKKMSKSKGNVINPDDIIEKFGADTLRVYEMFMGPLDADKAWDIGAVAGVYRFINKIYTLFDQNRVAHNPENAELKRKLNKTIEKVGQDLPEYKYNTAIASLMEFCNLWSEVLLQGGGLSEADLLSFVKIMAPFAPFLAEELYALLKMDTKYQRSVHEQTWPSVDLSLFTADLVEIVVQVNAKVRGRFKLSQTEAMNKEMLESKALETIQALRIEVGKAPKVIIIPGKLVNVVLMK